MTALGGEWAHLVQTRLQEELTRWSGLAACSDLAQAFAWQRRSAQKATTDYVDEATKLSRLAMAAGRDNWRIFEAGAGPAASQDPRAE